MPRWFIGLKGHEFDLQELSGLFCTDVRRGSGLFWNCRGMLLIMAWDKVYKLTAPVQGAEIVGDPYNRRLADDYPNLQTGTSFIVEQEPHDWAFADLPGFSGNQVYTIKVGDRYYEVPKDLLEVAMKRVAPGA